MLQENAKNQLAERKSNDKVLRSVGVEKELLDGIKEQQMKFSGQIIREGNIEELITTWRIEGTRYRGRQRIKQLDNIRGWLQLDRSCKVIHSCWDREQWKPLSRISQCSENLLYMRENITLNLNRMLHIRNIILSKIPAARKIPLIGNVP